VRSACTCMCEIEKERDRTRKYDVVMIPILWSHFLDKEKEISFFSGRLDGMRRDGMM